jgi:tryptophanyl-tRNA synthetase
MEVVLTGIKPTGQPGMLHVGNYVGAMKPSVAASRNSNVRS